MITRQFATFVAVSAFAALANFGSRIAFDVFVPYSVAIVMAFFVGLSTAFVLNKRLVFPETTQPLKQQMIAFLAVNLAALVQTLVVSNLLARYLLPSIGVTRFADSIAHAVGIGVPAFTSFFAHRKWSFR